MGAAVSERKRNEPIRAASTRVLRASRKLGTTVRDRRYRWGTTVRDRRYRWGTTVRDRRSRRNGDLAVCAYGFNCGTPTAAP